MWMTTGFMGTNKKPNYVRTCSCIGPCTCSGHRRRVPVPGKYKEQGRPTMTKRGTKLRWVDISGDKSVYQAVVRGSKSWESNEARLRVFRSGGWWSWIVHYDLTGKNGICPTLDEAKDAAHSAIRALIEGRLADLNKIHDQLK